MTHALNRCKWDGERHHMIGVRDGVPTAMLCGAGADVPHTNAPPTCPRCRRLIDRGLVVCGS